MSRADEWSASRLFASPSTTTVPRRTTDGRSLMAMCTVLAAGRPVDLTATEFDLLAKLMSESRVHGQDRRYHHPRLGINGRFDTLQAAVLLAKMDIF